MRTRRNLAFLPRNQSAAVKVSIASVFGDVFVTDMGNRLLLHKIVRGYYDNSEQYTLQIHSDKC